MRDEVGERQPTLKLSRVTDVSDVKPVIAESDPRAVAVVGCRC